MRITFFTHGSRGDFWPMVVLATQLARRDHDITFAAPEEQRAFVEGAGLRVAPLPFDPVTWLSTPEGQQLMHTGGITFIRRWQAELERHAEAFDAAYQAAATGAEAIVCMLNTWDRALAMADHLQVPIATVHVVPVAPTREHASLITRGNVRDPRLRMLSHRLFHWMFWRPRARSTNAFRAKLGLPECSISTFERLQYPGALGLHPTSPSLYPRPTDWPDHLKLSASWWMPAEVRAALGEGIPDDLDRWLDAGPPPVYLGFGSMPVLDPRAMLDDIIAVTRALGLRALVNADSLVADGRGDTLPDHIRAVASCDHDRLFPRCAGVVHHGGGGSTLTSLRAGVPTMACSVMADQPWWGEHLKRLGVGTHVGFKRLDRARLQAGLSVLLQPDVKARAQALGARICSEGDGLPAAGEMLDDWLVTAEPPPTGAGKANARRPRRNQLSPREQRPQGGRYDTHRTAPPATDVLSDLPG